MERSLPFQLEPPEAVFLRAAFLVTLFLVSHAAMLAVMLYALQRQMRKQRMTLHRRELCYLALVPTAGILFGQVISRLLVEFKDGVLLQLYERHPAFLAVVPVLALLFYAGAYLTIAFQQGMAALREEQDNYFVERQQTQAIRARIHEAEQFYTRIRQLKHEMRGHMTNIKALAGQGEYASLEDYIARMDESMMPISGVNTGAVQPLTTAEKVLGASKVQKPEEESQGRQLKPMMDEYVPEEPQEPSGRYWMGKGEDGQPKIYFDDPERAADTPKQPEGAPDARKPNTDAPEEPDPAGQGAKGPDGKKDKDETWECNTDKVDREIEKLKKKQQELEQRLNTETDEAKIKDLERQLSQVERELQQKDNDTYRKQNASFTQLS